VGAVPGIAPARTRYRLPAPPPSARIIWPRDFGTRALIFIDTEEEFDWSAPLSPANRSTTTIAALPDAHRRFSGWGAPLTLMVDYPVATDPAAHDVLRAILDDGASAVGAQLHPWVNPPIDEALVPAATFPGNLPAALQAAKLDVLSGAIVAATGVRPIAYRAGRYGLGPDTLGLLAARGYRIDSSMRARYDYRDEGGPDFGAVGNHAFWADRAAGLIELPLTTVFTGLGRAMGQRGYAAARSIPHGPGLLARTGLLSRVSLTPEGMLIADALEAIRVAAGEGEQLLAFSFHSPSLVPGNTPYVRDAADLSAFWRWWDQAFALMATLNIRPVGLSEAIAAADRAR